jgi:hypothetical protein
VQEGLPRAFSHEIFNRIDEWFGKRPQIHPPNVRDFINLGDRNFAVLKDSSYNDLEVVGENVRLDSMNPSNKSKYNTLSTKKPMDIHGSGKGMSPSLVRRSAADQPLGNSPHSAATQAVRLRNNSILLSSSELGGMSSRARPGSTGIRRRMSSTHNALANAAKATGDVMVAQIKELVGATQEIETNRLGIHLKLFEEKMAYQREKDQRLYE